jgi:hypothetical protein
VEEAAHHRQVRDPLGDARLALQGRGQVGQRPDGHNLQLLGE